MKEVFTMEKFKECENEIISLMGNMEEQEQELQEILFLIEILREDHPDTTEDELIKALDLILSAKGEDNEGNS
jgi:hypothetical protein